MLTRLIPSMYHRRLLLLLGGSMAAFVPLAGQLVNVTLVRGEVARAAAEAKLVREHWTPTVRGRILDRKGRVLAQDHPSYAVEVGYPVITGRWADVEGAKAAKRRNRAAWEKLGDEERGRLIAVYQARYHAHLERMWDDLAAAAGVPRDEIDARRRGVVERVTAMKRAWVARGLKRDYAARLEFLWERESPSKHLSEPQRERRRAEIESRAESLRASYAADESLAEDAGERLFGPAPDQEFLERALRKIARQRIAEEDARHAIAEGLSDAQGFAFLRFAEAEVDLDLSAADIADAFTDATRAAMERVDRMPTLRVVDLGSRAYPFEEFAVDVDLSTFPGPLRSETVRTVTSRGVASHILGRMRTGVHKEDHDRRGALIESDAGFAERVMFQSRTGSGRRVDRGRYVQGDSVGAGGVEESSEAALRGLRGLRIVRVDTGVVDETAPEPGRDVRLGIDAALQARVQAVMDPALGLAMIQPWQYKAENENPLMPEGTPVTGAAVVIEVDTGEILAMVSTPAFTREDLRTRPEWVFNDPIDVPHLNKAIARPYPPGSIAKALVLAAAATRGHYPPGQTIECGGHLLPERPELYRCWIWKQYNRLHGPLDAVDALKVSCNIFFFTLGRRLGVDGIVDAYRRFGVGEAWNLGVGIEYPGTIGPSGPGDSTARLGVNDAIMMAIGQGPIAWTPLHAADAYATLARAGVRVRPRLIIGESRFETGLEAGRLETGPTQLSTGGIAAALEGLKRAVNEQQGTGHHLVFDRDGETLQEPIFNAPGVTVWGKTGTADAPPLRVTADGRTRVVRDGDHSWFVILVGPRGGRPLYSVAVMMEYAGSGGKVSGPIANQIVHALITEGYLPGGRAPGASTGAGLVEGRAVAAKPPHPGPPPAQPGRAGGAAGARLSGSRAGGSDAP